MLNFRYPQKPGYFEKVESYRALDRTAQISRAISGTPNWQLT
jgi:hypothetical protein